MQLVERGFDNEESYYGTGQYIYREKERIDGSGRKGMTNGA